MSYLDDAPEPAKALARKMCPWCRRSRPVLADGSFRRHTNYAAADRGSNRPSGRYFGSHKKPEEFE